MVTLRHICMPHTCVMTSFASWRNYTSCLMVSRVPQRIYIYIHVIAPERTDIQKAVTTKSVWVWLIPAYYPRIKLTHTSPTLVSVSPDEGGTRLSTKYLGLLSLVLQCSLVSATTWLCWPLRRAFFFLGTHYWKKKPQMDLLLVSMVTWLH